MSEQPPDAGSPPPRRAKGPQPQYFDDPAIDQLHAALLALAAELSVAFDRIDAIERVLEDRGNLHRHEIDEFVVDAVGEAEREARRTVLVNRILRPFRDYRDTLAARAAKSEDPSADQGT